MQVWQCRYIHLERQALSVSLKLGLSHFRCVTMPSLPSIETLPDLGTAERAQILDLLFEPCRQLHTLSVESLKENTYASYDELVGDIGRQLQVLYNSELASDEKWLNEILAAHPRLGEKKVDSEQSRAEQAQLQGSSAEAQKLAGLNEAYEKAFPGLRYV